MSNSLNVINTPWFHEGLRFGCTECGKCCTGSPGYVWVTIDEMDAISRHLNLTLNEFTTRFVRKVDGAYSLTELPVSYSCVFLKENKCQIYSVRPKQCRTFPWWKKNLQSKEEWLKAAEFCEGINHSDAPLIEAKAILDQLAETSSSQ